jgi:hypothetical protein
MLYSTLKQEHPDFCGGLYEELGDFYEGGHRLLCNAKKYLPKYPNEAGPVHEYRVKNLSYVNHLGQIVDYYVANLFAVEPVVTPPSDAEKESSVGSAPVDENFYTAFGNDADRKGTPFAKLARASFAELLLKRQCLVAVDLPAADPTQPKPETRADEEKMGADRAYLVAVPVEMLTDWSLDEVTGEYDWAKLRRQYDPSEQPEDKRGFLVDEFKLWRNDNGTIRWELYRTPPFKPDAPPSDGLDIPLHSEGVTTFKRIPLVRAELPAGLWVGNKLLSLAREHFRRRSMLMSAEDRSLVAIPWIKLGPEIPAVHDALPSDTGQGGAASAAAAGPVSQFRSRGWTTLTDKDDIGFAEPEGKCYELTNRQLGELVDEMHRTVHQMAQSVGNTTKALGRSGKSKQQDKGATEVVLGAYGSLVRDWCAQIYGFISDARGEKVEWVAHGLDEYNLSDRDAVLKEAEKVELICEAIPSPTFKKHFKMQVALQLMGDLPPSVQDEIRDELEEAVDEAEDEAKQMHEAMLEAAANPPQPPQDAGTGSPAPPGQPPPAKGKGPGWAARVGKGMGKPKPAEGA